MPFFCLPALSIKEDSRTLSGASKTRRVRSRRVRDAGRLCTSFDPSVYSGSNPERLFSSLEEESKGFDFVRTENRPHYAHDASLVGFRASKTKRSRTLSGAYRINLARSRRMRGAGWHRTSFDSVPIEKHRHYAHDAALVGFRASKTKRSRTLSACPPELFCEGGELQELGECGVEGCAVPAGTEHRSTLPLTMRRRLVSWPAKKRLEISSLFY